MGGFEFIKEIKFNILESQEVDLSENQEQKKRKRKVDDYDYEDDFIEPFEGEDELVDIECKLENFFVYKGQLKQSCRRILSTFKNRIKRKSKQVVDKPTEEKKNISYTADVNDDLKTQIEAAVGFSLDLQDDKKKQKVKRRKKEANPKTNDIPGLEVAPKIVKKSQKDFRVQIDNKFREEIKWLKNMLIVRNPGLLIRFVHPSVIPQQNFTCSPPFNPFAYPENFVRDKTPIGFDKLKNEQFYSQKPMGNEQGERKTPGNLLGYFSSSPNQAVYKKVHQAELKGTTSKKNEKIQVKSDFEKEGEASNNVTQTCVIPENLNCESVATARVKEECVIPEPLNVQVKENENSGKLDTPIVSERSNVDKSKVKEMPEKKSDNVQVECQEATDGLKSKNEELPDNITEEVVKEETNNILVDLPLKEDKLNQDFIKLPPTGEIKPVVQPIEQSENKKPKKKVRKNKLEDIEDSDTPVCVIGELSSSPTLSTGTLCSHNEWIGAVNSDVLILYLKCKLKVMENMLENKIAQIFFFYFNTIVNNPQGEEYVMQISLLMKFLTVKNVTDSEDFYYNVNNFFLPQELDQFHEALQKHLNVSLNLIREQVNNPKMYSDNFKVFKGFVNNSFQCNSIVYLYLFCCNEYYCGYRDFNDIFERAKLSIRKEFPAETNTTTFLRYLNGKIKSLIKAGDFSV